MGTSVRELEAELQGQGITPQGPAKAPGVEALAAELDALGIKPTVQTPAPTGPAPRVREDVGRPEVAAARAAITQRPDVSATPPARPPLRPASMTVGVRPARPPATLAQMLRPPSRTRTGGPPLASPAPGRAGDDPASRRMDPARAFAGDAMQTLAEGDERRRLAAAEEPARQREDLITAPRDVTAVPAQEAAAGLEGPSVEDAFVYGTMKHQRADADYTPDSQLGKVAFALGSIALHPVDFAAAAYLAPIQSGAVLGEFWAQERLKMAAWRYPHAPTAGGEPVSAYADMVARGGDPDAWDKVTKRQAAFAAGQLISVGLAAKVTPALEVLYGKQMVAGMERALAAGKSPYQAMILAYGARVASHAATGSAIGATYMEDDVVTGALLGATLGGIAAARELPHATVRVPVRPPAGKRARPAPTATPAPGPPPGPAEPDYTVEPADVPAPTAPDRRSDYVTRMDINRREAERAARARGDRPEPAARPPLPADRRTDVATREGREADPYWQQLTRAEDMLPAEREHLWQQHLDAVNRLDADLRDQGVRPEPATPPEAPREVVPAATETARDLVPEERPAKKPPTPQVPTEPGTAYVLPQFVTGPHRKGPPPPPVEREAPAAPPPIAPEEEGPYRQLRESGYTDSAARQHLAELQEDRDNPAAHADRLEGEIESLEASLAGTTRESERRLVREQLTKAKAQRAAIAVPPGTSVTPIDVRNAGVEVRNRAQANLHTLVQAANLGDDDAARKTAQAIEAMVDGTPLVEALRQQGLTLTPEIERQATTLQRLDQGTTQADRAAGIHPWKDVQRARELLRQQGMGEDEIKALGHGDDLIKAAFQEAPTEAPTVDETVDPDEDYFVEHASEYSDAELRQMRARFEDRALAAPSDSAARDRALHQQQLVEDELAHPLRTGKKPAPTKQKALPSGETSAVTYVGRQPAPLREGEEPMDRMDFDTPTGRISAFLHVSPSTRSSPGPARVAVVRVDSAGGLSANSERENQLGPAMVQEILRHVAREYPGASVAFDLDQLRGTGQVAPRAESATPSGEEEPHEDRDVRPSVPGEPGSQPAGEVRPAKGGGPTERGGGGGGGAGADRIPERTGGASEERPSPPRVPGARPTPPGPREPGERAGDGGDRGPAGPGRGGAAATARRDLGHTRGPNYELTPEVTDALVTGGPKAKATANLAALRLLQVIEGEDRPATRDEQDVLSKYTGWGALPAIFDEGHKDFAALGGPELRELLTDDEYASARASTPNAHFTSPDVVRAVHALLIRVGFDGGRILEPSMGAGYFLGLTPADVRSAYHWTGVELDHVTGRLAKLLYPRSDVRVQGFEKLQVPDGYFDAAIGNVPFGDYKVHDPRYNKLNLTIHNYFFRRTLDLVRPGGIVAYITSRYTMDAQDPSVRRELAKYADLVGAIRLPETAFKGVANTSVVTDLIVLKVRAKGAAPSDVAWEKAVRTDFEGTAGLPTKSAPHVNEYFLAEPQNVLGKFALTGSMYGGNQLTVEALLDRGLPEQLRAAIGRFPTDAYTPPPVTAAEAAAESLPVLFADESVKENAYVVEGGKIRQRRNGQLVDAGVPAAHVERVSKLVDLRVLARAALKTQFENQPDATIEAARKQLEKAYTAFTKTYGPINKEVRIETSRLNAAGEPVVQVRYPNLQYFDDGERALVAALEEFDPDQGTATKGDMLTHRVFAPRVALTHVDTPAEALPLVLAESGRVDLAAVARLAGVDLASARAGLKGLVFEDPENPGHLAHGEVYLSGDVKTKLAEARVAAAADPRFQENVVALEPVQPEDLPPSKIAARLGAPWIPTDDIKAWIKAVLSVPHGSVSVHYSPVTRYFVAADWNTKASFAATNEWGTSKADAIALINDALNLKSTVLYHPPDETGHRAKDTEATLAAQEKQQGLKDHFAQWLWQDPARALRLAAKYNDEFNRIRNTVFDGAHLTLPGSATFVKGKPFSLRPHQKNAIWRHLTHDPSLGHTGLFHVVGSGKTYTMVGIAMEMKRLGLARKPLQVVPNHMLEQFSREAKQLYPASNLLLATKEDFAASERKEFVARAATNDWDMIIMTQRQFQSIGMSPTAQKEFMDQQLREIAESLQEAKSNKAPRSLIKQIEKAKKDLEVRILKLLANEGKDNLLTFEEMGVDLLLVDEADAYKNLYFTSRLEGISAPNSLRAFDMLLKTIHMERVNPGRGLVFATGTPIANQVAEMYTIQRYLQGQLLKDRGLAKFDDWAATFGETVTALELKPDNSGFRLKTRFAKYTNMGELAQMFRSFADVQTAEDLDLPRPTLKGGQMESVGVPATEDLKKYIQALAKRGELVQSGSVDPTQDNWLKITSDGRHAALDLRLVSARALDLPDSKVNRAVDRIHKIWDATSKLKGTQLVFLDISTPGSSRGEQGGLAGFNVYEELRNKLVARGLPKGEVRFMQDAKTDEQKRKLFQDVRAGRVRVLIGSTEKMGAGTNVQDRLVALHHLDAPWRPRDVEQRNGRILRQGNQLFDAGKIPHVEVVAYLAEGSFDGYMWQGLERKAGFISQALKADASVREVEDVDHVEIDWATAKAIASGNPMVKEKAEVDVQVARLLKLQRAHNDEQFGVRKELVSLPAQVAELERSLARQSADMKRIESTKGDAFTITIAGVEVTKRPEAGEQLLKIVSEAHQAAAGLARGDEAFRDVGQFAGFDLTVVFTKRPLSDETNLFLRLKGDAVHFREITMIGPFPESAVSLVSGLEHMPDRIVRDFGYAEVELRQKRQRLADLQEKGTKKWQHLDKLNELKQRQVAIDKALSAEAKKPPAGAPPAPGRAEEDEDSDVDDEGEGGGGAGMPFAIFKRGKSIDAQLAELKRRMAAGEVEPPTSVARAPIDLLDIDPLDWWGTLPVAERARLLEVQAAPVSVEAARAGRSQREPAHWMRAWYNADLTGHNPLSGVDAGTIGNIIKKTASYALRQWVWKMADELGKERYLASPASPDPLKDTGVQGAPSTIGRQLAGEFVRDPSTAGKPNISAPEVMDALAAVTEAAGKAIELRVGRMSGRKFAGWWNTHTQVIRTKQANDIATAAHEVAHALESLLWGDITGSAWVRSHGINPRMQRELIRLGKELYGTDKPAAGYKREGWAEFVRTWVTESDLQGQPAEAATLAPRVHRWFEGTFATDHPKVWAQLEAAREATRTWRLQGSKARGLASVAPAQGRMAKTVEAVRHFPWMERLVEQAEPLYDLARAAEAQLGRPLAPSEDPFLTLSALRTTHDARAAIMVEHAMIDLAGNRVGPALNEIRPLVEGRREDFTLYLWARRAIALATDPRGPRDAGLSYRDAEQLIKELETPAFQLAASKVYAWTAGTLDYAAEASPTFAHVVENVRARDPGNYLPLQREFDELDDAWRASAAGFGGGGGATRRSPVKRLKGSGRRIKDPFPVLIAQTSRLLGQAHQRLVLDQVLKLASIKGMGQVIEEVPQGQRPAASATVEEILRRLEKEAGVALDPAAKAALPPDILGQALTFFAPMQQPSGQDPIVPLYAEGRVRWFYVDASLYATLSSMDVYRLPMIAEWLVGKPASVFRAGTTGLRPAFGLVWNPLRDLQTLMVNTRAHRLGAVLFKEWLQGLGEMALARTTGKHSASVDLWMRLGGEMAQQLGQDIPHTQRAARRLFEGRLLRTLDVRNWFDFYRDLVQFPEAAPRVAELRMVAQDLGWTPGQLITLDQSLELLLASKQVTTDFTAAGEWGRVINRMVPFHNAAIQGPRANLRAARRNPSQFAWRGLQLAAATLLLWWLSKDEDWYKNMPYRERFMNWHFPITLNGVKQVVRIPRAFEVGMIFAALPEMMVDAWYREAPEQVGEYLKTLVEVGKPNSLRAIWRGGLPIPVPELPMLNTAAEELANTQFPDRPIVTESMAQKPPAEQYAEYTSRAAIELGRIFDASPARIDHIIRGLGGQVAGDLLTLLGVGPKGSTREKEAADTPIIGGLLMRGGPTGLQPRPITDLYDLLEDVQLQQHSDRSKESKSERQLRLQLEDAAKAVSALLAVRHDTPKAADRQALTREAIKIAEDAVAAMESGTLKRGLFRGLRKRSQKRLERAERDTPPLPE